MTATSPDDDFVREIRLDGQKKFSIQGLKITSTYSNVLWNGISSSTAMPSREDSRQGWR